MHSNTAQVVAEMVSEYNLKKPISADYVLSNTVYIIGHDGENPDVKGTVQIDPATWCMMEIKHLAVREDCRNQKLSRNLLYIAEKESKKFGALLTCATVRSDNIPMIKTFQYFNYTIASTIYNRHSKNNLYFFLKNI